MTALAASSPSTLVTELTEQAGSWRHVTLAPHSRHAVAFRLEEVVLGILHYDGLLEVPVPAPIRTPLLAEGLAVPQPARSTADWVARSLHTDEDVDPATLLLRLSYLYRRLLRSRDPALLRRIRLELAGYALPASLQTTYAAMIAKRTADPPGASSPSPRRD
jgi:hypothetical protein